MRTGLNYNTLTQKLLSHLRLLYNVYLYALQICINAKDVCALMYKNNIEKFKAIIDKHA